jgi:hypothetical protein
VCPRRRSSRPAAGELSFTLDDGPRREKGALLALYESERSNLSYVDAVREAFWPLASYNYARPLHDGPMFYQRFQWVPRHPRIGHTRPDEVCRAIDADRFATAILDGQHSATP